MKIGLQRVFIWVNIQKKFQVPRSLSIGEKCDANFKLQSIFLEKCETEEHEIWFAKSIHMG